MALSATVRFWGIVIGATALASRSRSASSTGTRSAPCTGSRVVAGLDVFGDARAERSAVAGGPRARRARAAEPDRRRLRRERTAEASRFESRGVARLQAEGQRHEFVLKALVGACSGARRSGRGCRCSCPSWRSRSPPVERRRRVLGPSRGAPPRDGALGGARPRGARARHRGAASRRRVASPCSARSRAPSCARRTCTRTSRRCSTRSSSAWATQT